MTQNDETTESSRTWLNDLNDSIGALFARNSMLLTGLLAAFIIFMGYTLIETPGSWYIPIIVLGVALVLLLVFVEARSVLKLVGATIMTIFASGISFLMAGLADPYTSAPLLWFASYWVVFFGAAASSYMVVKGRSRWGAITLAEFCAFASGYIALFSSIRIIIAAITSTVVGIVVFFVAYHLNRRSRYRAKNMPVNVTDPVVTRKILDSADAGDWLARSYENSKTDEAHYLVWNKRAYLILPVYMDQPFSIVGSRWSSGLGYKGRPINPWLVDLIYNRTPFWTSRSAPIMIVLLDLFNANGHKPRTIAASLPDTKHRAPVGVMPIGSLKNNSDDILKRIDDEFGKHTNPLTEKQLKTLTSVASKHSGAEYETESLSDVEDNDDETREDDTKTS